MTRVGSQRHRKKNLFIVIRAVISGKLHKLALFPLPICLIKEAYLINVCYTKDALLVHALCTFVRESRKTGLIFVFSVLVLCAGMRII